MQRDNEHLPGRQAEVIHILASLSPSGMERMLVSGAPYVNEPADHLVIGQGEDHPFADELRRAGYNVSFIPSLKRPRGIIRLTNVIRNTNAQVVHIHTEATYWQAVFAVVLARTNCAVIRTIHSMFDKRGFKRFYRRAQNRLADWRVDEIICCSPEVQRFEEALGRNTTLVWNWVDDRFFEIGAVTRINSHSGRHFLIIGNCSEIKNHCVILQAILQISSASPFIRLAHVGSEANASTEEVLLLDELQKRGILTHRGSGDPTLAMTSIPTYLLSSLHEGMCVSLAEALVAGLPVVIADAPGVRWSRSFKGVALANNSAQSWTAELNLALNSTSHSEARSGLEIFRAERGISSYAESYARAKRKRNR